MSKEHKRTFIRKALSRLATVILPVILTAGALAVTGCGSVPGPGSEPSSAKDEIELLPALWPEAFNVAPINEPPFVDSPDRTNNAFNVQDFGEQGTNGWFYRYGNSKRPQRSRRLESFDGEKYFQIGVSGLEIKKTFLHTADRVSPILEWRVAEDGAVNVTVTYVKSVNGDQNPSYPDGVQLMVYKGSELLKLENVPISTEEETLAQITIEDLDVIDNESLYFVVDPKSNNAFDGGSLYIAISDVDAPENTIPVDKSRSDNNANSVEDFGEQGSNGWAYLYGTDPDDCAPVSHENDGEYINATSPNLSISQGFQHPALNHNAVLGWTPAVNGNIDLRIKYTKFEQHDGNPDFPDGVTIRAYKNDDLLYEKHVDAPDEGENKIKYRVPKLYVDTSDRLYFMIDAEGNSSYDGGAFDITIIDIRGAEDESDVYVSTPETRQNFADVKYDFGEQGSNGWIFQWGYEDDPYHAYNAEPFDYGEDRYFYDSYLEIKRDYVNPGTHDRSAIIKWRVAQNGTVSINASYTKMKNEDANPAWPDGTRVSLYHNGHLRRQQYFAPEVNTEVTKRLDIDSEYVEKGDYLTLVINGLDNTAYDGGKYEFSIRSLSGLVGEDENDVRPWYNGKRVNFASTLDDFDGQGYNGWYYQFGYYCDPFFAVNVERCENGEKYYTSDGVEIKKDFIVPGNKGKSANVKWIAAETGKINIDLEYTKLRNEDANPSFPDGVTVYLMRNNTVLREEYFSPRTDREVTKSLAIDGVSVSKGDAITMIVDPGENNAYDGGKYMFVIEDTSKVPVIKVGNHDNSTSLRELPSIKQGTDGWWFLEGTSPGNAKVLTKLTSDKSRYGSRRTEGLEMGKDFVHTGATRDPIYLWIVGQDGKIDVTGSYMKYGQEDPDPSLPDGVTVTIRHGSKVLLSKKVNVYRGDGNNNVIDFSFDALSVRRGDWLTFQISADNNYAWDGGQLSVVVEPTSTIRIMPGEDNWTVLREIPSVEQGTDGWYFFEGNSPDSARLLTKLSKDKSEYTSRRTDGLSVKKDFVHTGAELDPIYEWVVARNGDIDIYGTYTKYGQEDQNPDYPDGVTVIVRKNDKVLLRKKVKVLKGDGNNNVISFHFDKVAVKRADRISFQISRDKNYAWDGGQLSVVIEPTSKLQLKPGSDNNTVLGDIKYVKQGIDGWYFYEGTSLKDAKPIRYMNDDKSAYVSKKTDGLEMKKDYVHPGAMLSPIYRWVVAKDGEIDVFGRYIKFGHADENPDYPDGVTLTVSLGDKVLLKKKVAALQGDGNDNILDFSFEKKSVKRGDVLSFQISCDKNNAWDAGQLAVAVEEVIPLNRTPGDDNNTVLGNISSMEQGTDGWWFLEGTALANVRLLTKMNDDKTAYVSKRDTGLEMKKDYVHPGTVQNPYYQWVVKDDGVLDVQGSYVKFGHNDSNPDYPDGVTLIISHNDKRLMKKQVDAFQGDGNDNTVTFSFKDLEVKSGDIFSFRIMPNGNNAYDAGRLNVVIGKDDRYDEVEPDPNRTNNTVLKDSFGRHGTDGWYYGMCDWDGTGFEKLPYDSENNRYYNDGKPELKADFVEPGSGKNAAYKWVVAKDGTINVKGDYTKFANNADEGADGTTVRFFLNGHEEKFIGMGGRSAEERTASFDETYEVKAGDILIFAVNPEGNDSYDGGRLSIEISDITDSTSNPGNGGQISSDPSTPAAADAEAGEKKADDKKDADMTDLSGNGKDDASEADTAVPAAAETDAGASDTEETADGSTEDAAADIADDAAADSADDADAESTDDEGAESADDEDTEETGDSVSSAPENKGPGSSGEDAGPMKTTK